MPDPRVITISGSHSGVGKTYLATLLIRSLPGFAAIKVTQDDLLVFVTDEEAEIMRPGKKHRPDETGRGQGSDMDTRRERDLSTPSRLRLIWSINRALRA